MDKEIDLDEIYHSISTNGYSDTVASIAMEMFTAFCHAGFTSEQSLELTKRMLPNLV